MVVAIRIIIAAAFCWGVTVLGVWHFVQPVRALIGAKSSAAPSRVHESFVMPDPALNSRLLGDGVWMRVTQPASPSAKQEAEAMVGPPKPVFWEHLASVRAKPSYVVLRSETGEVRTVAEGQLLPDGKKLLKVSADSVTLSATQSRRPIVVKTYLN